MSHGGAFTTNVGGPARCRSCAAPIRWVKTSGGKATPLDAEPVADGEWQIADGYAVQLGTSLFAAPERYRVHWATCPSASEHRRSR